MRLAASCDIGLSWRHPDLDASLELSTKVLEFGALGLPVILNRTPIHEALLGADYPLFAVSLADVAAAAAAAAADPGLYRLAAGRAGLATRTAGLGAAMTGPTAARPGPARAGAARPGAAQPGTAAATAAAGRPRSGPSRPGQATAQGPAAGSHCPGSTWSWPGPPAARPEAGRVGEEGRSRRSPSH